jgi:hypothetical protein
VDSILLNIQPTSQMSFPSEDLAELSMLDIKHSPKSFLSSATLSVDSDEDNKREECFEPFLDG